MIKIKDPIILDKVFSEEDYKILHDNLTAEEADRIERELVAKLGRKGINIDGILLNKSSGGQKGALGIKQSPETIQKKRLAMQGKKMHSDQQKQKWSLERTGRKNNWDPNHIKADKGNVDEFLFWK
jgi:hypothetical protein